MIRRVFLFIAILLAVCSPLFVVAWMTSSQPHWVKLSRSSLHHGDCLYADFGGGSGYHGPCHETVTFCIIVNWVGDQMCIGRAAQGREREPHRFAPTSGQSRTTNCIG